jgi:hypothetical protein
MLDAHPANYSEARRYLHSPRISRTVWLSSRVHKKRSVTAPGSLLTVHVWSGLPRLRVLSGNVLIIAASYWGNSVTVLPAAAQTTTVHVHSDCKASIYGLDSSRVTGDFSRTFLSEYRPAPAPAVPVQDCPF